MVNNTSQRSLLGALQELVQAHRRAFKQDRPFWRAVGMVLGEVFNLGRHTVTQALLTLGMQEGDWSGWYRLFSRERFAEEQLSQCLLDETLKHVKEDEPYCVALDSTVLHRSSLKMPGTSWLRDSRFSAFRPGIHRGQRFVHGAWLTPLESGYSRAIPVRFLPAFPPKAVASSVPPRTEWETGGLILEWLRGNLDQAGRQEQKILALADAGFDVLELWRRVPENVILLTRTARNRCLYYLPTQAAQTGPGRPTLYGERAPRPVDWLHAGLRKWPCQAVEVRGKTISMRYQVLGPFLREGLPERPLFLIVVKGIHRKVGKKKPHYKHKEPAFYLISAVPNDQGSWQLPLPIATLLAWLWQRWEIEVAHHEMKTGLGLGEKQCWNKRSSIVSVQWSAWVYAILLLAGYRTWGVCNGPPTPARWWPGAKRWSFTTLWRSYRAELWNTQQFRLLATRSSDDWWKIQDWFPALSNSLSAASRI
ncbi:MAG TPA: transposase [Anaerolineales bacterium]|nr:transposase [Anaerolineales bacterium]